MTDVRSLERFGVDELRSCVLCGRGVMHSGDVHFYEVRVTHCVVDTRAVQQLGGMEDLMGGSVALARALSPVSHVAHRMPATRALVCAQCALLEGVPVAEISERASE